MAYDTEEIKSNANIADVIGSYVDLIPNGAEFKGCCPFHDEKTPSFNVVPNKQFYHCFGCGAHGDVIDFVVDYAGVSFKEACDSLGGDKLPDGQPIKKKAKSKRIDIYEHYSPVKNINDKPAIVKDSKTDLINPKKDGKIWQATPSMVHPYFNADGSLHGYVLRIDMPDGKKITPQVRWCENENGNGWTLHSLDEPRPLYGLKDLIANPDKQVLIVEGEKCRDFAHKLIGDKLAVISWAGGTNGINKTDWTPITNRKAVFIPDNDDTGFKAMQAIADLNLTASNKFITPDNELEKGWDIADGEWENQAQFLAWCKEHTVNELFPSNDDHIEQEHPPIDQVYQDEPGDDPIEPAITKVDDDYSGINMPFRILGHYKGTRYYLPDSTKQLVELAPAQHTKNNLLSLAPLQAWNDVFGDLATKNGLDAAVNGLLQMTAQKGLFNSDSLRGRGAWIDEGRAIVHMGNRVYVDNVVVNPKDVKSKYIYQQDIDLGIKLAEPATNKSAHDLMRLCKSLSWENELSATLLAGWCIIAPLTGILSWRPHIWVTGPSGAGKSTVLKSIISVMMGDIALKVEGKTTEAGIRQQLGIDARPVIFDEAEAEDRDSIQRLKGILDFARVCSSGGNVVKGSATGGSVIFSARSAFCFSSINTSVNHFADESRISQLVLRKDFTKSTAFYDELELDIMNTITPEFADAMFSRSVGNMETLQANCKIFAEAANLYFRNRRIADQVGVLLAGAYLCYSSNKIDRDKALEWIKSHNWEDHTAMNSKSDSSRLLSKIATHRIRILGDRGQIDITIGEAIIAVSGEMDGAQFIDYNSYCNDELKRIGIKVEGRKIYIANNSDPMKAILKDTPWESNWARALNELEGSEKHNTMYFAPGIKGRAVVVELEHLMG